MKPGTGFEPNQLDWGRVIDEGKMAALQESIGQEEEVEVGWGDDRGRWGLWIHHRGTAEWWSDCDANLSFSPANACICWILHKLVCDVSYSNYRRGFYVRILDHSGIRLILSTPKRCHLKSAFDHLVIRFFFFFLLFCSFLGQKRKSDKIFWHYSAHSLLRV